MKSDKKIYDKKIVENRNEIFKKQNNTIISNEFFKTIEKYLKNDISILDIGTGNGYVLKELNERYNFNLNLYGNDISSEMIKQAQKNCKKIKNINFVLCSNYNLKFEDNKFDIVVAKNVTRFSAKEVYRILKPNGIFIYREYGKYKGMVEISKEFKSRLIRSRYKSFYDNKMRKANFEVVTSCYIKEKRKYNNVNEIIKTIEAFPMILNFNDCDKNKLIQKYNNVENIEITSDAFLAVYKKGGFKNEFK